MANPLDNEKELYERIRNEKITVPPEIWDLLYNRIGDDISAINLFCQSYLAEQKPVPPADAKKILSYTRRIKEVVDKVTLTRRTPGSNFPEFLEGTPLDPVIIEMFTHYIGNDTYCINLRVEYAIDPQDPQDLPLDSLKVILSRTRSIRAFMDRLREATMRD